MNLAADARSFPRPSIARNRLRVDMCPAHGLWWHGPKSNPSAGSSPRFAMCSAIGTRVPGKIACSGCPQSEVSSTLNDRGRSVLVSVPGDIRQPPSLDTDDLRNSDRLTKVRLMPTYEHGSAANICCRESRPAMPVAHTITPRISDGRPGGVSSRRDRGQISGVSGSAQVTERSRGHGPRDHGHVMELRSGYPSEGRAVCRPYQRRPT